MDADEPDRNRTPRERGKVHRRHRLRSRPAGLTREEYFRTPVPNAWGARPGRGRAADPDGCAGVLPRAPPADLVPHVHREPVRHLSEARPPRDLYPHAGATANATSHTTPNGATR
jgi:hypothetical protein